MAQEVVVHAHNTGAGFTLVRNEIFKDARLSWKARGLLAYLLGRPDGWQLRIQDLQNRSTDGRDACYSGLAELEEAGYIKREQRRENGKLAGYAYHVYDAPQDGKPEPDANVAGNAVEPGDGQRLRPKADARKYQPQIRMVADAVQAAIRARMDYAISDTDYCFVCEAARMLEGRHGVQLTRQKKVADWYATDTECTLSVTRGADWLRWFATLEMRMDGAAPAAQVDESALVGE